METLEAENDEIAEVFDALCHELRQHTKLSTVRQLSVGQLTLELIEFIYAATNMSAAAYFTDYFVPSVPDTPYPLSLPNMTFMTYFFLQDRPAYYEYVFQCINNNLRAMTAFNLDEVVIGFHFCIDSTLSSQLGLDVFGHLEAALIIPKAWAAVGEDLERHKSLPSLRLEVRVNHSIADLRLNSDTHRCRAILEAAAIDSLPWKYINILSVDVQEMKAHVRFFMSPFRTHVHAAQRCPVFRVGCAEHKLG